MHEQWIWRFVAILSQWSCVLLGCIDVSAKFLLLYEWVVEISAQTFSNGTRHHNNHNPAH